MSRVSTFGQTQILIQSLLDNQRKVFDDQRQLASGKKAVTFAGLASDVASLIGAKSFKSRMESFKGIIKNVEARVEANDVQLNGVLTQSREFRQTLISVLAQDEALAFREVMTESFNFTMNALNTEVGGLFVFGGSKTDTPPINASDISDLIAAASSDDLFQNDNRPPVARISDNVQMEFGIVASDIASDLFASYKRIADYDANGGTGPINGKLTAAQRTFLKAELQLFDAAIDKIQSIQTRNGLRFERLQTLAGQHEDTLLFLEIFISEIEDTNMAEAVTRLNIDQVALEVSLQTMASLSRLSLLDFI